MNDTVIQVRPHGQGFHHATACCHTFATSADLAARQAGARALGCEIHEVALSQPTPGGIYVATRREPAAERRAS